MIPVKNQATALRSAVLAVLNQSVKPSEIVVVDGHSQDDVSGALSGLPVRLVSEDYGTRGGAIMVGLDGVDSEYVAFTDADCVPEQDWLERLLGSFRSDIVGVGGLVLNEGETKPLRIVNAAFSSPLGSGISVQGRVFRTARDVTSISGSNSVYRLDAIRKCGGFDVRLAGAEDAEMNSRIMKLGRLTFSPNAVVHHYHGRGYRNFVKRMFHYGRVRVEAGLPSAGTVLAMLPPIVLVPMLVVAPFALAVILLIYVILLFFEGLRLKFLRHLSLDAIVIIPFVLVCEHVSYSLGAWYGSVKRLRKGKVKRTLVCSSF